MDKLLKLIHDKQQTHPAQISIIASFDVILKEARLIPGLDKNEALLACDKIEDEINDLHSSLHEWVDDAMDEVEVLKRQLNQLNDEEVTLTSRERQTLAEQTKLNSDKSAYLRKKENINSELRSLSRKLEQTNEQIEEEEKKREDAVIGLFNPFYTVYTAFRDDDPKKLIPGYSVIDGLVSVLTQEKENLESERSRIRRDLRDVESDLDEVERDLRRNEREMREIKSKLDAVRNRILKIGRKIQNQGRDLTKTGNVLKNLQLSQTKFAQLKHDVFMIKNSVEIEILDDDLFDEFIGLFKLTKDNFLSICQ